MRILFRAAMIVSIMMWAGSLYAGQHTGNGYFGSITWRVDYNTLLTEEVGPYLTYGDCYDAWMDLAHSRNLFQEAATGCHLRGTSLPYVEVSMAVDFVGGDDGKPGIDVDEMVRISEEIHRLRREYNIEAYEKAIMNLR